MTTQTTVQTTQTAPVTFNPNVQPAGEVQTTTQVEPQKQSEPVQVQAPFKAFQTQEDFDNETAKIRGVAERKAENEILKALGIDSKDKLEAIKQAYQNSLTEEDRKNEALKELDNLKSTVAEKDAIIAALTKLSGKETSEVTKLVKMAKGLVSDDYTIEQALDEVMKLVNNQQPQQPKIPVSQPMNNPPQGIPTIENPFKNGNLTEAGKMIKENPQQARELARLANYPITW